MSKKQSYKLTIDNPCQQDWSLMTQNKTGRFCDHCVKTVIDFSSMTDLEIHAIVSKHEGQLCGRLTDQQLNRILVISQERNNRSLYKIVAGLLFLGAPKEIYAINQTPSQQSFSLPAKVQSIIPTKEKEKENPDVKNIVQGIILDAITCLPIPDALIVVKGTQLLTHSDTEGKFRIIISDSLFNDNLTLLTKAFGYYCNEIQISQSALPMQVEITLAVEKTPVFEITEHRIGIVQYQTAGLICIEPLPSKKWFQFWKK
jgi:hypothetical protein